MGADGGTIPKRCELVKQKKKGEKIEKAVKNAVKWRTCQMSGEPLQKPIVACKLGRLYNKDVIIEGKLTKSLSKNSVTAHIKALSDVKELKLTDNKTYKEKGPDKGDVYKDHNDSPYICAVTGLNMNGTSNFVVNWNCGCVFSEKAMIEVKSDRCHGCGGPFSATNIVQLNPDDELLKVYEKKLAEEQAAKKAAKKTVSKRETADNETPAVDASDLPSNFFDTGNGPTVAKPKVEKLNDAPKEAVKRKADRSIQDDPNASKAFKSIFTTSEAAKNQPKAHWITHNPLYF